MEASREYSVARRKNLKTGRRRRMMKTKKMKLLKIPAARSPPRLPRRGTGAMIWSQVRSKAQTELEEWKCR